MARKPAADPGTLLPRDWRRDGRWQITASLAAIPDTDYARMADAFEAHHRAGHTVSVDWTAEFRTWCRREAARKLVPIGEGLYC